MPIDAAGRAKDAPRRTQDAPRRAKKLLRRAKRGPKRPPRDAKTPRRAQDGENDAKIEPRWHEHRIKKIDVNFQKRFSENQALPIARA